MAKFKEKYRSLVLPTLADVTIKEEPIRLMFSPGSDTYFFVQAIARQKGLTPREVLEVGARLLFLSLIGEGNEPINNT